MGWGYNYYGPTNVPAPNANFVAVAAGYFHSLGLKADGSIVAWGFNGSGQIDVPAPNADFMAVAAGGFHSLGIKAPDTDGDGVIDRKDACLDSDLAETLVIDGCDSGAGNHLFDDGCTMADRIAACAADATQHGDFVSCVAQLTHDWTDQGVLAPQDKGPIQRCAAQASLPLRGGAVDQPPQGESASPLAPRMRTPKGHSRGQPPS